MTPTNQLTLDYLDALTFLRPRVQNIQDLLPIEPGLVELEEGTLTDPFVARFQRLKQRTGPSQHLVTVNVNPALPRIERVEMNIWIAAAVWFKDSHPNGSVGHPDFAIFCKRLGCCPSRVNDPRERWRQLGCQQHYTTIPVTVLEDRPRCKVCPGYVATGAGVSTSFVVRDDVHDSCYRFAHEVLVPALEMQRATAKEAATNAM